MSRQKQPRSGPVSFWFQQVAPAGKDAGEVADEKNNQSRKEVVTALDACGIKCAPCLPVLSSRVVWSCRTPFSASGTCKRWLFCPYCYMRMAYEAASRLSRPIKYRQQPYLWSAEVRHTFPRVVWFPNQPPEEQRHRLGGFLDQKASHRMCLKDLTDRLPEGSAVVYRQWLLQPGKEEAADLVVGWRFIGVSPTLPKVGEDERTTLVAREIATATGEIHTAIWELWNRPQRTFAFPDWARVAGDTECLRRAALVFNGSVTRRFREFLSAPAKGTTPVAPSQERLD